MADPEGRGRCFSSKARSGDEAFELRLAHRECDDMSLDYTLVMASPDADPLHRMRAIRALEIAVTSSETRPQKETTHAA